MRRLSPLLLLTLALAPARLALAAAPDWSLSLEERLLADDNVLKLSDGDLDQLQDDPAFQPDAEGGGALKFEHRVTGEARWKPTSRKGPVALLQRWAGGKPGQGRVSLGWDGKWTTVSGLEGGGNNSQRLALGWQPRTGWGAEFAWRYLDNYDLRRFTDRDTGRERGASFDSDLYQVTFRARGRDLGEWFRQPGIALALARSTEYYNAWFTEYDAEALSLSLGLSWRMPAGLSAGLGWQFTDTDNVGYAGANPGEVNLGADSEGGDASQQEDQFSLDLGWSGELGGWKSGLDAGLTLRDRRYQSALGEVLDPFHYGRHDQRWLLSLRGRLDITPQLRLIPVLEYEQRSSEAAWSGIGAVKDYRVRRAGLGLRWSLDSN
jgi:hypothetical protein